MNSPKYLKKLISLKFSDRNEIITGLVVDYNEDWTLMKYNTVDYIIDGYIIIRHKNIEGFKRESPEKFTEKVLKLKGIETKEYEKIPLTDLSTILNYLTERFGVFQIYTKSEKSSYLGRLISLTSKKLVIENFTPKGKWDGQITFRPGDLRTIEFDNDYINSLKLIAESRK
ncbi:hypothetical protein [Olleya sp. Bg11-27]|uniref:hypothetical protein n=1 Tax=Olleya sp. Bg11-27 TaxID=2058135 RepID=UPI000C30F1D9|nr:hypothetical protein [Olleya sp. Bg11-27]AUC76174.1 hypothetical protein CW732_11065 [Olleya sp. Bg11-27]